MPATLKPKQQPKSEPLPAPSQATAVEPTVSTDADKEGPRTICVPGVMRKASTTIARAIVWEYGQPKIGKTTFASHFPGAWFIATEPGQNFIDCHEPTTIVDWDNFMEVCAYIASERPAKFGDGEPINTLVIDTVDLLFRMCNDYVCHTLGVEDLGELAHGKGWSRLTAEWTRVMTKVFQWPYTQVYISHAAKKTFKSGGSQEVDMMAPDIGAAGMRVMNAAADLILYAHVKRIPIIGEDGQATGDIEDRRVMQCHPSSTALAGGRMAHMLPPILPLEYAELTKAFKVRNGK